MDDNIGKNSQLTAGNTAIPEWMQKRRSRQQSSSDSPEAENDRPAAMTPAVAIIGSDTQQTGPVPAVELKSTAAPRVSLITPDETTSARPANRSAKANDVRPKRAPTAKPAAKKLNPNLPVGETTEAPPLPWHQALREEWLNREALSSYAVSFATHLLIALMLSLLVFHQEITGGGGGEAFLLGGDGGSGGEGGEGLDDSNLLEISPSEGQPEAALDTMLSANAVTDALGPNPISAPEGIVGVGLGSDGPGSGNGKGSKTGDGTGDGNGVGGYSMPEGGKFVRKGSFTAWTVPQDPAPGEDYKIIIQVRYKDAKQKLTVRDITGSVVGTDMFRLMISKHTAEFIPSANQVVVNIPGAAARVHDTIKIYSTILKENQRLEIDF